MKYRVNEIFHTLQGEGMHVGLPATFIRLQICTVGCPWCDTQYTWAKGGVLMPTHDIVAEIPEKARLVIITGGEPTVWNLNELIETIAHERPSASIHMETSGQNDMQGTLFPDWITWSPKRNLNFKAAPSILKNVSEVKFVVDEELSLEEVWDCLEPVFKQFDDYPNHPTIVMMPEGCPPSDASMQKAYQFTQAISDLTTRPVRMIDRLQYRLGVQ